MGQSFGTAALSAIQSAQEQLDDLRAQPTAADLAEAQAQVASAQAQLDELLNGASEAERRAAEISVEQAQRRNQLRRLHADVDVGEQRLRALMGLTPEAPVDLVPTLALSARGSATGGPSQAADGIEAHNPSLERLRREYEVSEETLRREVRKQYPDLTLGPLFESDQGHHLSLICVKPRWAPCGIRALALYGAFREFARDE